MGSVNLELSGRCPFGSLNPSGARDVEAGQNVS